MRALGRIARLSLLLVAGATCALILVEGIGSLALLLHKHVQARPTAERRHTRYDPDLGWVNVPNVHIPDMYGPGVSLRINGQGFRGPREVGAVPPRGRSRLVCSGDSTTLGYGVDDSHTWCERLAARDARLEPVNMGQGGYGVDQAYLWFRRDGMRLEPDIHLFTFILLDFYRMESDSFVGYGKPILRVRDETLVIENVPVPRRALYAPWWGRILQTFRGLRAFELAETLVTGRGPQPAALPGGRVDSRAATAKIFESLRDFHRARGSVLVLVFLPRLGDRAGSAADDWRGFVRTHALRLGIPYVDLIARLREVSPEEAAAMFFLDDTGPYTGAAGHYTVRGNEHMAAWLHDELMAVPTIAARLTSPRALPPSPSASTPTIRASTLP